MTPIYESRTKHTKEMLKHFIKMTYEVKNPNTARHIAVFSACWFLLAYIARDEQSMFMIFITLGVIGFLFVFTRTSIAVMSLGKKDEHYQKGGDVLMTFGHKGFTVESSLDQEVKRFTYNEVTSLYKDKIFYFLGINNEEMQIISREGFGGQDEAFETFVQGKVGRDFYEVNLPFIQESKRRWVRFRYNFAMKKLEAEEQQNAREERIQAEKKAKKNKKKR